jgi:hypothetical protein
MIVSFLSLHSRVRDFFFCSSWYYGNTLYMYGGVNYPIEVIQNGLYALNLSASLPFTWQQLNYPLANFATLLGRRGHGTWCMFVLPLCYLF